MYLICYVLSLYRNLEVMADRFVQEVYPYYESGDIHTFDEMCINFTRRLNQGKSTKKQRAKTYSIYKSLNILTNLDEDYNEFLVNKFMSSSDISNMGSGGLVKL